MKILFLIGALLFSNSFAFANENMNFSVGNESDVPATLKIVGKGIIDRKSGNAFALACVGPISNDESPDCSQLRHVYFDSKSGQASFYGDVYTIKIEEINRDFKKFKRAEHKNRNIGMMVAITIGGGTAIALAPFLLPVSFTAAKVALALNWGLSVPIIYQYGIGGQILSMTAESTNVFQDQNGWNWAVQPKAVSHRTFELYRQFLDHRPEKTYEAKLKKFELELKQRSSSAKTPAELTPE